MWNLGQGRGDDHLVDGVTTISLIGEVAVVVVPGFDNSKAISKSEPILDFHF